MESNIKNQQETQATVENFSLQDFIKICAGKWLWFVVSLILCVGLGLLYIYSRQPVYERSEEILIKDQEGGGGVADVSSAFASLGLVSSNTSVYNELISLKSPAVMQEVVKRLDLDMNYNKKGFLHPTTLYGNSLPVIVDMLDFGEQRGGGFKMELNPDGSGKLFKFYRYTEDGKEKLKGDVEMKAGATEFDTPIGKVKITPNPEYKGQPIDEKTEIAVSKSSLQSTIELYCQKLDGDLVDQDADVIGLSIKDVCVQRAVDILNTVLQVYNENWVADKNKMAVATSAFIDERLLTIQQELGDVDESLAEKRSQQGIAGLGQDIEYTVESTVALDREIVDLNNRLEVTRFIKDFLANGKNEGKLMPVNSGVDNKEIEELVADYNSLLIAKENLIRNSSENNPLVESYDAKLSSLRHMIEQGVNSQISILQTNIKNIRQESERNRSKIKETPMKSLPLLSGGRQQKVKEELYIYLLQKREENELSQKFTADNVRVITPPMGSLTPVSPRKKLILMVSIFFGVCIPIGLLYLQEASNTKVRGRKDLENVRMPFAGEIPHVGKKTKLKVNTDVRHHKLKDEKPPLAVVEEGKRDVVNEAFRVIRSNIDFMSGKDKKCEVIMLTSFNPGSGKSFITYNLGLSFALKKKRVLIIDCDLRHGSSSMYVGMPSKGLSTYLTDQTDDWKSLVKKSPAQPDLDILPIGKMPPNPAELLENERIATVIDQAKEMYDYILLDCPPVNIVVDTQIVGQYADRTLFVVRAGLLEKSALRELDEFYTEKKFKRMSVILNGTEAAHSRYYTYGNYQSYND